jgi:uncharacterized protein YycO
MPEIGDILLIRGKSPWERAVEWATSSPYGHCAMLVMPGKLVEAKDWRGIQTVPAGTYSGDWFRVTCTPDQRVRAVAWALARVGQPYGWIEAAHDWNRPFVGLELARRTRLAPVDCSGLVAWSFAKAGVTITRRPYPTPADLSWSVALQPL